MNESNEIDKLIDEDVSSNDNCNLCKESNHELGQSTGYGVIIHKIGNKKNGWFATLSPKTGGNPELDFTIQLMPRSHLTHFSQMESYPKTGENYGISFSKICKAMTAILMQDESLKATSKEKNTAVSLGTYGKSTTWKEKKEHLHVKIFPFRNNIGQPYTVDSSFGKKEIFEEKDEEFVKMKPVRKVMVEKERFEELTKRLISLLNK